MNKIKNLRRNKKGFTLVEVIVVLVILAILIAIAVPSVMKYIDDANDAKYLAQGRAAMITTQTELAYDYADDKKLNGSIYGSDESLIKVIGNEVDITVKSVELDGEAYPLKGDAMNKNPNKVKVYKITLGDDTVVTIPVNGEATVE